jgi:hypothetical protein
MAKDDWIQVKKNVDRKTPPEWIGGYISKDGQSVVYIQRFTRWFGNHPRKEWTISKFSLRENRDMSASVFHHDLLSKEAAKKELMRYVREHKH